MEVFTPTIDTLQGHNVDEQTEVALKDRKDFIVELSPLLRDMSEIDFENSKTISEILGYDIDAVLPLAGGVEKYSKENGQASWRSPVSSGVDSNSLPTLAGFRVAAAYSLLKTDEKITCIVTGEYPQNEKPSPYLVANNELFQMGVDSQRIVSNPETYDTVDELVKLIELSVSNGWDSVGCITNEYHAHRVGLLLNNLEWLTFESQRTPLLKEGLRMFEEGNLKIHIIKAEEILKNYEDIYESHGKPSLKGANLITRYQKENEGVRAIRGGVYNRYDVSSKAVVTMRKVNNNDRNVLG